MWRSGTSLFDWADVFHDTGPIRSRRSVCEVEHVHAPDELVVDHRQFRGELAIVLFLSRELCDVSRFTRHEHAWASHLITVPPRQAVARAREFLMRRCRRDSIVPLRRYGIPAVSLIQPQRDHDKRFDRFRGHRSGWWRTLSAARTAKVRGR